MKLFSFLFVFCCPPFSASDRITSPPSDLSTYRYAIFRLAVIANRPKLSGKWSSSSQTSYPTLKEVTTFLSQIDHPYQPTNDSLFPNVVGFYDFDECVWLFFETARLTFYDRHRNMVGKMIVYQRHIGLSSYS